jgi:predicted TIM-barrel enzyme
VVGRIAAAPAALERHGPLAFPVLAPVLAALPATALPSAALLAIHDLNGLLFEALAGGPAHIEGLIAALFCCDPLRSPDRLARHLGELGIRRVVAFPSIGAFDGQVRRDLEDYGFHYEAELEALRRFEGLGFEAIAGAADRAHLTAARRHGVTTVLAGAADAAAWGGGADMPERLLVYSLDGEGLVIEDGAI